MGKRLHKKSERQKKIERNDKLFSLLVRKLEPSCITCGSTVNGQCGHYISRSCKTLRWDFRNAHRQCYTCNVCLNGNMTAYALEMLKRYGENVLQELEDTKKDEKFGKIRITMEFIDKQYEILKKMEGLINNDESDNPYNTG